MRSGAIGGVLGALVWLYDHDFLLNAGGPDAPVSRRLLETCHLTGLPYPAVVLTPLVILVISGAVAGAFVGRLVAASPRRPI
jgi:hypothetical protein